MTAIALVLHVSGGTLALFAGIVAIVARKGGVWHRIAGTVFFVSMLVMAVFAAYLAVVIPGQIPNLFAALFSIYLVGTALMTVRRKEATAGAFEIFTLVVSICVAIPILFLAFQVTTGGALPFKSAIPIKGPVLVALYTVTVVILIAALSDAKVVIQGGIAGAPRLARHLWRMCFGLMIAAGSAFTNGLPRLLPGPMHVTTIYFLPQFVPIGFLIFWMIRVRLTTWSKTAKFSPPLSFKSNALFSPTVQQLGN
jgi:predicted membrane protein DUF2306